MIDALLQPHNFVPLCFVLGFAVSFGLGSLWTTKRVEVIRVPKVPEQLARLASIFGITEDIPAGNSYGRLIHDLFEERDREIASLKFEVERSAAELTAAREEADSIPHTLVDVDLREGYTLVDYRIDETPSTRTITKQYRRTS